MSQKSNICEGVNRYFQKQALFFLSIFVFTLLISWALTAQPSYGSNWWAANYWAVANDRPHSVQQTSDGGYIVAGETQSFGAGSTDIWVVKIDPSGNVQWQRTYGREHEEVAYSIQQTTDGGYILAGYTRSDTISDNKDFLVLKLDASGIVEWERTYGGGEAYDNDIAYSVQQTSDGGYIVAGEKSETETGYKYIWVLKLDASGIIQWQKRYNRGKAYSIQQTADGGYIVTGGIVVWYEQIFLLKLEANGDVEWQKILDETLPGGFNKPTSSIQQTTDGGYVLVTSINSYSAGASDIWVVKFDSSGNVQWQKTYGDVYLENASSIQQTLDGGYIVACRSSSFTSNTYATWVFKLDVNGIVEWQKIYGGAADGFPHIRQTSDSGYILASNTYAYHQYPGPGGHRDFWILRLKPDGTIDPSCPFADTNISGVVSGVGILPPSLIAVGTTNETPQDFSVVPFITEVSPTIRCEAVTEDCTNGIDDNGDGLIDCEDPDCKCSDPACVDWPSIFGIIPNKGGDIGSVSVIINGCSLQEGASVKLVKAGQPEIVGDPVTVEGTTGIKTTFDLIGMELGLWDVVVTNPSSYSYTLSEGFTIEPGEEPELWVDILIPDFNTSIITVIFGNKGNVDTTGFLEVQGPPEHDFKAVSLSPPPPIDGVNWDNVPQDYNPPGTGVMSTPVLLSSLPPDVPNIMSFSITPPPCGGDIWLDIKAKAAGAPCNQSEQCIEVFARDVIATAIGEIPVLGDALACVEQFVPKICLTPGPTSFLQQGVGIVNKSLGCAKTVMPLGGVIDKVREVYGNWQYYSDLVKNCGALLFPDDRVKNSKSVFGICSADPNDKVGPAGYGVERYVSEGRPFPYLIRFENLVTASAPAQEVLITDQLDVTKYDLSTFLFGPITFGDKQVAPMLGQSEYSTEVDLRPDTNLIVRINAQLNKTTGLLTWHFTSIDPDTGEPPADPLTGFLPPNIISPQGEGRVIFTVMPKEGLATGTEIRNKATIVFDVNPPIDTDEWLNTIDITKPESQVLPLTPTQDSTDFLVEWFASDVDSDIMGHSIFVSEDGGPYTEWLHNTTDTGVIFTGQLGMTYAFYSVARDNAGNKEDAPAVADTTTTVACPTYYKDLDGDGYGDPAVSVEDCTPLAGYVADNTDCDDADANEFPGQTWHKDADGDGYSDGTTTTACARPVGYKLASELTPGTDCNDGEAAINPGATEVFDSVDNNCNGAVDEGFTDADGDGYAVEVNDCDDTNAAINPLAVEVFDGVDNNCDGTIDEGFTDADADGYAAEVNDCDDADAAINLGATEVFDGIDNNCDGVIDEGFTDTTAPEFTYTQLIGELWPANHKMVLFATVTDVSDLVDASPNVSINVTSNQPINGKGDGNTDYDWEVIQSGDTWNIWLRAERAGGSSEDRIYTIGVNVSDDSGNLSTSSGTATVPHDKGKKDKGKK